MLRARRRDNQQDFAAMASSARIRCCKLQHGDAPRIACVRHDKLPASRWNCKASASAARVERGANPSSRAAFSCDDSRRDVSHVDTVAHDLQGMRRW
jgi:hypothetical protein